MKNGLRRKFARNISYAFTAQFFTLVVNLLMTLIVSKILGVEQFSYWQLFIFYSGYVGLLHFGLTDGVYLRYGGIALDEMEASIIGAQMRLMMLIQFLISSIVILIVSLNGFSDRGIVWLCIAIYLVLANLFWYLGYIFQAANETKVYSFAIIIVKTLFIIFTFILIFLRTKIFIPFIAAFLISHLIGTLYIVWKGRRFFCAPRIALHRTIHQAWENIRVGINLTIANIASSLILGVGRMMIDAAQGITTFGMVSLALSLTNFFLQFISQVSLVMFPMLRKFDQQRQKQIYMQLRKLLSYALCGIMVLYAPTRFILARWLPQYELSLVYLGILLPICIFDGKTQLLYNTYLKVLRKENALLKINIGVLLLSIILCAFSIFVLHNINVAVVVQVFIIAVKSISASCFLAYNMDIPQEKNIIWELLISTVFIVSNQVLPQVWAFIVCSIIIIIYWYINRKEFRKLI